MLNKDANKLYELIQYKAIDCGLTQEEADDIQCLIASMEAEIDRLKNQIKDQNYIILDYKSRLLTIAEDVHQLEVTTNAMKYFVNLPNTDVEGDK